MTCEMDTMLEFNKGFVERKEYEAYRTDKLPDKKLAVLSCMDTRLTSLLPAALNFKNGDVRLLKMRVRPSCTPSAALCAVC